MSLPTENKQSAQRATVGYHRATIAPGRLGETSKIQEELEELEDAMSQGVAIMAETELADMYGAIQALLERHFPHLSMADLDKMAQVTRRAFDCGHRISKG